MTATTASLFDALDPPSRDALMAAGSPREVATGAYVCRQGDPPGDLYIIREGRVRVMMRADGEEIDLAELGAGNFFGEMSPLHNEPRSTSVLALEPTQLVAVSSAALESISRTMPDTAAHVFRMIAMEVARRLRRANELLLERYRDRSHEKELMHLIVHDLRSPLAVAEAGATQLLERPDRHGALAPAQERVLRRIRRSHALVRQLAEEVLEVGRSAKGVRVEERTTLEAALLEAVPAALARVDTPGLDDADLGSLDALTRALAPHDIHIVVPADLARTPFLTDRLRLIQVILNLVGNAVKHAPGWLRIEASRAGPDAIRVAVSDRGAGIPESFRASIFEQFRQADAKKSGVGRGFGFGLAAAKLLIESLGGRIAVDSDPARAPGATFTIEVPFRS